MNEALTLLVTAPHGSPSRPGAEGEEALSPGLGAHCSLANGPFSGSEDGDQLLWRPGVVAESQVKEYLVEAAFRTGNEKMVDRVSAGALTRDSEQVGTRCCGRSRRVCLAGHREASVSHVRWASLPLLTYLFGYLF